MNREINLDVVAVAAMLGLGAYLCWTWRTVVRALRLSLTAATTAFSMMVAVSYPMVAAGIALFFVYKWLKMRKVDNEERKDMVGYSRSAMFLALLLPVKRADKELLHGDRKG